MYLPADLNLLTYTTAHEICKCEPNLNNSTVVHHIIMKYYTSQSVTVLTQSVYNLGAIINEAVLSRFRISQLGL